MMPERFGSPEESRKAGRRRRFTPIRPKAPRMAERMVEDVFTALDERTPKIADMLGVTEQEPPSQRMLSWASP